MKIITISAKTGEGKDFCANIIRQKLEAKGNRVLITHYADLLKYICKSFFEWDGRKNVEGRTLLQCVESTVYSADSDYWVKFLIGIFNLFKGEWDYVLIPDTKYLNEIELLAEYFDVTTLKIVRPNYENDLTDEQKNHPSETALDNYRFDYTIVNNGDDSIYGEIQNIINSIGEV